MLSFWQSRELAEKHREARARFRGNITATVNVAVEDVTDYEVSFAELGALSLGEPT